MVSIQNTGVFDIQYTAQELLNEERYYVVLYERNKSAFHGIM